jgi:hypothetical protein
VSHVLFFSSAGGMVSSLLFFVVVIAILFLSLRPFFFIPFRVGPYLFFCSRAPRSTATGSPTFRFLFQ